MIRLLYLFPGRDSEMIECHLRHVSLCENPMYEGISYRCGDQNDRTIITCNNKWLSIPKTLAGALRSLRKPEGSRVLWADAICINEADTAEREKQVQLMRIIYSQAQGTLVWLGDAGEGDEQLRSLAATTAITVGLAALSLPLGRHSSPDIRVWNSQEMKSHLLSPFSYRFYTTFINMLSKPWFQRAWIVQEVATSSKGTVIQGVEEYDWDDLVRAQEFMSRAYFPLAFMPSFQHIAGIESERRCYNERANSLLGLLLRHQHSLATDPRDKIYAFCGLMETPLDRMKVRINYKDDVALVYWEVAVRILCHDRTLDILSQPPSPASWTTAGLPSWVPDWNKYSRLDMARSWEPTTMSLAGRETSGKGIRRARLFAAAGDSEYSPEFSASGKILIVNGYVFDTVTEAGPVLCGVQQPRFATTLRGIVKGWLGVFRSFVRTRHVKLQWEEIAGARTNLTYATGEDILGAYWQTICAGESPDSPAVRSEMYISDMVNRFPLTLRKLHGRSLILPYSAILFLWWAIVNSSLLKFEMKGHYTLSRKLIKTSKGYIGLASGATQLGDSIALYKGSRVPLLIRGEKNSTSWRLVGDAYVHGIMNGEKFKEENCEKMSII